MLKMVLTVMQLNSNARDTNRLGSILCKPGSNGRYQRPVHAMDGRRVTDVTLAPYRDNRPGLDAWRHGYADVSGCGNDCGRSRVHHCCNQSLHASMNAKSEWPACLCAWKCWGGNCSRGCCTAHGSYAISTVIDAVYPPHLVVPAATRSDSHFMLFSSRLLRPPIAVVSWQSFPDCTCQS